MFVSHSGRAPRTRLYHHALNRNSMSLSTCLIGRRILFIGIGFYDYEQHITNRLRIAGAQVVVFNDRPWILREGPVAALLRHLRIEAKPVQRRHEAKILRATRARRFDQIVVIKAVGLSVALLENLRSSQPSAEFVLYQWDAMRRLDGIAPRLRFFDRILSFDRLDVQSDKRFTFRPLFFREPSAQATLPDIDLTFVGQLHSDRVERVRQLEVVARSMGLRVHVHLTTGLWTWLRLTIRGRADGVHVRRLRYSKYVELTKRSRCVVDLPHPDQAGMTMRAIEAVGLGRKIITTATDITKYDFYHPSNIRVLVSSDSIIDPDFVRGPPVNIAEAIIAHYSVDAWILDVFVGRSDPNSILGRFLK